MSGPEEQKEQSRPTPLGIYDKPQRNAITGIEIAAIALTVVWLLTVFLFFNFAPDQTQSDFDPVRFLIILMAIFLPVAMIWVAATAARSSRVIREESHRLQSAIDAIRQAYVAQSQRGAVTGDASSVSRKLDEIAEATRKTETTLATFSSSRSVSQAPRPAPASPVVAEDGQSMLELGTPAEALAPPLENDDFIRALNFPETAEDEAGFASLRRALKDRQAALVVRAAQDILTLLSQDGIYMDDLRPDRARPEIWRQFATGTRGRAIAPLGGIRDRSSLALAAGRMKQDPIFRDAAHHFLRRFDQMVAGFEPNATDAEISALAETRTARAFMLLGRGAGTFD